MLNNTHRGVSAALYMFNCLCLVLSVWYRYHAIPSNIMRYHPILYTCKTMARRFCHIWTLNTQTPRHPDVWFGLSTTEFDLVWSGGSYSMRASQNLAEKFTREGFFRLCCLEFSQKRIFPLTLLLRQCWASGKLVLAKGGFPWLAAHIVFLCRSIR